jgi:hypothetical protein
MSFFNVQCIRVATHDNVASKDGSLMTKTNTKPTSFLMWCVKSNCGIVTAIIHETAAYKRSNSRLTLVEYLLRAM